MTTDSKDGGDETAAMIIHELVGSGHSVSHPFGDNDKHDLIVDASGCLPRVPCKTAWRSRLGAIRFNTHSKTTRGGEDYDRDHEGEIDAFLVRDPTDEALYWIDIGAAAERKMSLRTSAAIDHPAINWAEDDAFDGQIPRSPEH